MPLINSMSDNQQKSYTLSSCSHSVYIYITLTVFSQTVVGSNFMTKASSLLTIVLITTFLNSCGQSNAPLELSQKIFSQDTFLNIHQYVRNDYGASLVRSDLKPYTFSNFLLLSQNDTAAVVAMYISDTSKKIQNAYIYFEKKGNTWKMWDLRVFRFHGYGYEVKMLEALEELTQKEVDSLINDTQNDLRKGNYKKNHLFYSKVQFEYYLYNGILMRANDDSIVTHFLNNESEFESLKNKYLNILGKRINSKISEAKPEYRETDTYKEENTNYDFQTDTSFSTANNPECMKLLLSEISFRGNKYFPNYLDFEIGKIGASVGYLFFVNNKNIPAIEPKELAMFLIAYTNKNELPYRLKDLMMIREIKNGWYMYRTN